MSTILLSHDDHDLLVDANGNIAMASNPYAYAQDVATAELMFKGEHIYYNTIGIPYLTEILGENTPISIIKGYYETEALSVTGIKKAEAVLSLGKDRGLSGEIRVTTNEDVNLTIGI
jgi:hypothetical protein